MSGEFFNHGLQGELGFSGVDKTGHFLIQRDPDMIRFFVFSLCICFSLNGFGQLPVVSSKPVDETKISILTDDPAVIALGETGPVSNFRLFLKYDAPESIQLELAGHGIELPAGEGATVDVTFEHILGKPATIHYQRAGDLKPLRIEVPDSVVSDGTAAFESKPGAEFPMEGAFTLMARFKTSAPNGTLAGRVPEAGKWQPDGKTLFLKGGVLTYDIGWVGAIRGGKNLADGKEHIAVLTVDDAGNAELFVDGKSVAKKKEFTSNDDPKHVFKIGSTATNFGGDFKDGAIEQVMFWKRGLEIKEVRSLGKGDAVAVNTPDFHWKAADQKRIVKKKRALAKFGVESGFSTGIRLAQNNGAVFHEAWIQPLEKSDHAEIIANWNADSFERGKTIYTQLCVTCHGTAAQEGSIPLSLKFHDPKAEFKNGNDPFQMWQTLTKGYGLMTPMPQYSTRQKYDVIHYIREEFLAKANPKQLSEIDDVYLAALPRGMSLIEEKEEAKRPPQYELMDFGSVLFGTYQIEPGPIDKNVNIAPKGIAIRLDPGPGGISKGKAWAIYDHDTMRLAAFYTGNEFVDWKGIDFDGSHGTHTSIVGERIIVNPDKPGWANPETGEWDAPRVVGKDGRKFGPVPREWARYKGIHFTEWFPILEYQIGGRKVFEALEAGVEGNPSDLRREMNLPEIGFGKRLSDGRKMLVRIIEVGAGEEEAKFTVAPTGTAKIEVESVGQIVQEHDKHVIIVPASTEPVCVNLYYFEDGEISGSISKTYNGVIGRRAEAVGQDVSPTPVKTKILRGTEIGAFAVDILTVPDADLNPHQSWMRTSGFDFYPDGKRAAVCTWMGDVWIVEGVDQLEGELTWKRICSGLFQPLGLKIVDGSIYVTCRDQLAKLHDKNGDETIDFIECVNNDHQVTEHFHEFAMGLQTDADGNFYYAKSARHAKDSLVPHHGTLLRISADGEKTDILATGFRAANGVCLNPDGTFIVTDQEGHWNPKNRINWVNGDGPDEFFGNIYGYSPVTDTADSAMKNPLCWITNQFDRSPSELLWVPENAKWGSLNGQLLNLSYGYGKVHVVPHEEVNGQKQGGLCELPFDQFPTGVMRGRFHPKDGQLYSCGMFAWAGTQQQAGGFYRIRKTKNPAFVPTKLNATKSGMTFELSDEIDSASVSPENFTVKAWDLKRTKNYGSKHFNERELEVSAAVLADDKKMVSLTIPKIQPTWGMSIQMNLKGPNGEVIERLIYNSVFELGE